ncbi:MAG: hypothetical protein AB7D51_04030 [Desulfovibrionaceae bacterium]
MISALLTLTILSVALAFLVTRLERQIYWHANRTFTYLCEALGPPLWSLDKTSARSIVGAIAFDDTYGRIELFGPNGGSGSAATRAARCWTSWKPTCSRKGRSQGGCASA